MFLKPLIQLPGITRSRRRPEPAHSAKSLLENELAEIRTKLQRLEEELAAEEAATRSAA
jgi:hypothetical protein